MRKIVFSIFLFLPLILYLQSAAQEAKSEQASFVMDFYKRMDTVYWLCDYDKVAWVTSDSVYAHSQEELKDLSNLWFCINEKDGWHAFYGKITARNFLPVFHYFIDSVTQSIVRLNNFHDQDKLNSYARALEKATSLVEAYPDSQKIRFNQYIRQNDDSTFSVWFLPAFTTSGIAVAGGEFYYLMDKNAETVLNKNEYSVGYVGFTPNNKKEIAIDFESFAYAPVSAVFFVWYYQAYFSKIKLYTENYISFLLRDKGKSTWVHIQKENK